jgi:hypothetical protein
MEQVLSERRNMSSVHTKCVGQHISDRCSVSWRWGSHDDRHQPIMSLRVYRIQHRARTIGTHPRIDR